MQQRWCAREAMIMNRPNAKILVDGGGPQDTQRIKELLGFVDGQTTNPTLISKNPHIRQLIAAGHKLSKKEELDEYRRIVQTISPLVGQVGVSIEVFCDQNTTARGMLDQGREMFSWIANAYIKYPCTAEGLRAAKVSVGEGIRINMTLCFSQRQAAAIYVATKGTKEPVYVSPFVGRLDDIKQNSIDLVRNIKRMFSNSDRHVLVLAASIRSLEHLLYCFLLETELATVPAKILERWASRDFPCPTHTSSTELPASPFPMRSWTWGERGIRLTSNTSLPAKASKNSWLIIAQLFLAPRDYNTIFRTIALLG